MPIPILYESRLLLAVDKPAGLLVEHSPHYPSVEDWANEYVRAQPGKNFIGIIHRLDRPVSGVLLLARRKSALKALNEQFARREVRKLYWALVEGPPPDKSGTLAHWLVKDQKAKRAEVYEEKPPYAGGRPQHVFLHYRLLHQEGKTCLLEIDLQTGKYHQIRAQLAAVGCPILGDATYGARQPWRPEAIALHARQLEVTDPETHQRIAIVAPPPPGFPTPSI